jgi:cobalt-zinc-cadmium efflux system protein
MRSAYLHMVGDALAGVGVVIAGLIIWFTGSSIADPVVSLIIGALILYSSRGIWVEAVATLMEAAPPGVDVSAIRQAVQSVAGVKDLHCLHTWVLGSGVTACSCHVTIAPEYEASSQNVLKSVVDTLEEKFDFAHTTVQIEIEGSSPTVSCGNAACGGNHCPGSLPHDHD